MCAMTLAWSQACKCSMMNTFNYEQQTLMRMHGWTLVPMASRRGQKGHSLMCGSSTHLLRLTSNTRWRAATAYMRRRKEDNMTNVSAKLNVGASHLWSFPPPVAWEDKPQSSSNTLPPCLPGKGTSLTAM